MKPEEYDRMLVTSALTLLVEFLKTKDADTARTSAWSGAESFLLAGGYTREDAPEWTMVCCPWGHTFYRLPDHPTKINEPRCPHCMAKELDSAPFVVKPTDEEWMTAAEENKDAFRWSIYKIISAKAYRLASERKP